MRTPRWAILIAVLAIAAAACGSSDSSTTTTSSSGGTGAGDAVAGAAIYSGTCSACHGTDLAGIDGLGKGLAPSDFVASMSESELAAFLAVGRAADDPNNDTGVAMPPKGGNPSLTDQDLLDVSAYLKAQQ